MLDPKDALDMLEDYLLDGAERRAEWLTSQQEALTTLADRVQRVPYEQHLFPLERSLQWRTLPQAMADTAQWPVDLWRAQTQLAQAYWTWAQQSQAAIRQLWFPHVR